MKSYMISPLAFAFCYSLLFSLGYRGVLDLGRHRYFVLASFGHGDCMYMVDPRLVWVCEGSSCVG